MIQKLRLNKQTTSMILIVLGIFLSIGLILVTRLFGSKDERISTISNFSDFLNTVDSATECKNGVSYIMQGGWEFKSLENDQSDSTSLRLLINVDGTFNMMDNLTGNTTSRTGDWSQDADTLTLRLMFEKGFDSKFINLLRANYNPSSKYPSVIYINETNKVIEFQVGYEESAYKKPACLEQFYYINILSHYLYKIPDKSPISYQQS